MNTIRPILQALRRLESKNTVNWIEGLIKTLGIISTVIAIIFTVITYYNSEKWKVAEFTANAFKEFSDKENINLVNKMLDYNERVYHLSLSDKDTLVSVDDDLVREALTLDSADIKFSQTETQIRDIFDEYLYELSLFNRYINAGLMETSQVKPYLIYQIQIIADTNDNRKSKEYKCAISNYIIYYGFTDVKDLCFKFGYDITKNKCP